MPKNQELETINVGIFGHIDHGKTTLLQKLSGKWTDTHSEELKRGITIKLGYADIIISKDAKGVHNIEGTGTPVRHVSFVDSPGHEMLMATMLSGAALVDAAILVVAANEGIKPQTREHLMALQAKQIKNLIVVQNKIDLVTKEQALKNHGDIQKMLGDAYKGAPVIPVSAQQHVNIEKIWLALAEVPVPAHDTTAEPLFVVARSFDINRPGALPKDLRGAVLGGTLKRGTLKIGDRIEIRPGRVVKTEKETTYIPIQTKIRNLFRGSQSVTELTPGGSMSIETDLDMSLAKGDLLAGNVVSHAGKLPAESHTMKVKYHLFPRMFSGTTEIPVENLKKGEMLMISVNTSITGGSISHITKDEVEITLRVPALVFKHDNVGIARNLNNHWRLIGHGSVV